jgi:hypothetical protein
MMKSKLLSRLLPRLWLPQLLPQKLLLEAQPRVAQQV